ncbi:hypothetical protein WG66_014735 [Moniliophthora roreri]|nr:hypothetical protein WG66_014735 [Moniliophthora roreri]
MINFLALEFTAARPLLLLWEMRSIKSSALVGKGDRVSYNRAMTYHLGGFSFPLRTPPAFR